MHKFCTIDLEINVCIGVARGTACLYVSTVCVRTCVMPPTTAPSAAAAVCTKLLYLSTNKDVSQPKATNIAYWYLNTPIVQVLYNKYVNKRLYWCFSWYNVCSYVHNTIDRAPAAAVRTKLLYLSTNENVRQLKGTESASWLLNTPIEHVLYKTSAIRRLYFALACRCLAN